MAIGPRLYLLDLRDLISCSVSQPCVSGEFFPCFHLFVLPIPYAHHEKEPTMDHSGN